MDRDAVKKEIQLSSELSLILRLAEASDIQAISVLLKLCADWLEGEGYTHWKVYQDGPDCEDDVANGRVYCAFDTKQELVSTFTLAEESPAYAEGAFEEHWKEPGATASFFKKLAVNPKHHGNGIGKELLKQAESISREHGAKYLRLDINPSIRWLVDYYLKLGFELRAEIPAGIILEKDL